MKESRFSEEQIIGVLKKQQAGLPVAEICRGALAALRATGRRVERSDEALDLYRVDDGPELTTGGIVMLVFQLGLMIGEGPAQ